MADVIPITIAETVFFRKMIDSLLSDDERHELIDMLAKNPTAGVVIPDTGGLRKMRWAVRGRGKRGGARIIYYFHDHAMPLFLLSVYAKNDKVDLNANEKSTLKCVVEILRSEYASNQGSSP
jgi:hypothetical protein